MTEPIPAWIQARYAVLWRKFKDEEFTFKQAEKVLRNNKGINVFLSDLRKAGWIVVGLSEKDIRKRVYKLNNPNEIYGEMEWK
jgi:type I restriction enzyme M protein